MSTVVHISWWGHATATIEMAGTRVLTDPLFARRLAHLRRVTGPLGAAQTRDAHRADAVVISHLHRDHLHLPSVLAVPGHPRIIVPRGAAVVLTRGAPELAGRVEEVAADEEVEVGSVRITAVPAAHDGRRAPGSRYRCSALGYVLRAGGEAGDDPASVWFAGDTGLFEGMAAIGPVDIAVVPVGGWGPTLGPEHLDPGQAAEAVRRVRARDAVPVHFGTYWPAGLRWAHPTSFRRSFREPGNRFVAALNAGPSSDHRLAPARPHLLALGQSVSIPIQRPDKDGVV